VSADLRLLIVDGNPPEARATLAGPLGCDLAGQLQRVLTTRRADLVCETIYPCDTGFTAPATPRRFDGAIFTGSVLHAYEESRAVAVQRDLVREFLAADVDVFGLCWGLQIGCAALGGRVALDPEGPEIGLARDIALTDAGRADPVLGHRGTCFDSHAWHLDAVIELPHDAVVLASNGRARLQAVRIARGAATFLGVQYHPEYTCAEMANMGRAFRPDPPIETLDDDTALAFEPLRWLDTLKPGY